jgi:hypothetical protein
MVEEVFVMNYLYVILSQVIVNYWKKVKQPSHSEVNQDHVTMRSHP